MPTKSDPAWRVNIDGRVYMGHWGNKANAVFGAMRKDEIDQYRADYRARDTDEREPSLIGVEQLTKEEGRSIPAKVRRYE